MNPSDRYTQLIRATLEAALTGRAEAYVDDQTVVPMDLALPEIARSLGLSSVSTIGVAAQIDWNRRVVDGFGHSRPMYRGLLKRWLGDRTLSQRELSELARFSQEESPLDVSEGPTILQHVFDALAVVKGPHGGVALDVLHRVADAQADDGTFLRRTSSDNPEPLWYYELALLHALATSSEADFESTIASAVRYHVNEVQPDHASSHPWGLRAFLRDPQGIVLADMMLHSAGVQSPANMDSVSLVLLADAILETR